MPATHKVTPTILFLIFSLLLAACGGIPPMPTAFVTSQAPTIIVPTLTPRPTATVTPTEVSSAMQGTPLPLPLQVLAPENGSHMLRLARWGKGIPQQIAWAPDGSALVVAASGGLVFYDPSSLAETRIIETQSMPRSLAFSEDSSQLAVGFQDGSLQVWDKTFNQMLHNIPTSDRPIVRLAFSPDGNNLAVSQWDSTLALYQLTDPNDPKAQPSVLQTFQGHSNPVIEMVFNRDNDRLFAWSQPEPIRVWRLSGARMERQINVSLDDMGRHPQLGVMSHNSAWFAASYGTFIRLQRTSDGVATKTLGPFNEAVRALVFSPDSKLLATAESSNIKVWQMSDGTLLKTYPIPSPGAHYQFLIFSPDSSSLISFSDALRSWQLATDAPKEAKLNGYTSDFSGAFAIMPDSQTLVTAQMDGSMQAYGLPEGVLRAVINLPATQASGMVFSADGSQLALRDAASKVLVVKVGDGSPLATLEGGRMLLRGVGFSQDGQFLAAPATDKKIIIWRVQDAAVQKAIQAPALVWSVAFSPDGSLLAARSNGTIYVINVTDGKSTFTFPGYAFAFTPDGSQLAVASGTYDDSRIRLYQLSDGKPAGDFNADGGTLAFSPDGRLLAVSGLQLDLWQVPDGKLLRSLSNPAPYGPLTFSVDGKLIASAGWDGHVYIWGAK
jgi:WD40 repeat protein